MEIIAKKQKNHIQFGRTEKRDYTCSKSPTPTPMKNCFTGDVPENAPKTWPKPYRRHVKYDKIYHFDGGPYILKEHLEPTNTETIYNYNCDDSKFAGTGSCKDILRGRNVKGAFCSKKECDDFSRRGRVQTM